MRQRLVMLLLPFILIACNGSGSKKVKNIIELTPKLSVNISKPVRQDSFLNHKNIFYPKMPKHQHGYIVTKNKIIGKPIVYADLIYAVDDRGNVCAISRFDNKMIWSYNLNHNKKDIYIGGGIIKYQDKLYITYGSRFLVILDAKSGHEIIRKELPDIIRAKPVMLNDNIILVQTVSNQLFALDISYLNFVWQHEGMSETFVSGYYASPIVHDNNVIVNYSSGQIFALNIKNGTPLWTLDLSNAQARIGEILETVTIVCEPVLHNSSLYIATNAGKLMKLNIDTGTVTWHIDAHDIQSMSLEDNILFITNNAQQAATINIESGKVQSVVDLYQKQELSKIKATSFLPPLIIRNDDDTGWNLKIIANSGELYSLQADNYGNLMVSPIITKIVKNIKYYSTDLCLDSYYITEQKVIFTSGFLNEKYQGEGRAY